MCRYNNLVQKVAFRRGTHKHGKDNGIFGKLIMAKTQSLVTCKPFNAGGVNITIESLQEIM